MNDIPVGGTRAPKVTSIGTDVAALVGAIVLVAQDVERYLKAMLPFTDSSDPTVQGAIARSRKLQRRTFGEVVGRFQEVAIWEAEDARRWLDRLVDERNLVVHHFRETYGMRIADGRSGEVTAELMAVLANIHAFRRGLEEMLPPLYEALLRTPYRNTQEFVEMAAVCDVLRQRTPDR